MPGADRLVVDDDFMVASIHTRFVERAPGYRVVGTPPSEEELERALKAAGAKKGATVELGDTIRLGGPVVHVFDVDLDLELE